MSWDHVTVISAILVVATLIMLVWEFVALKQKVRHRGSWFVVLRNRWRLAGLLIGITLITTGLSSSGTFSGFAWDVLTSFLLVSGIQLVLSVSGIRLELLGSNPE